MSDYSIRANVENCILSTTDVLLNNLDYLKTKDTFDNGIETIIKILSEAKETLENTTKELKEKES